ncbi:MAG: hypothetical protein JNL13_04145 [Chitinophagaceae bacterium]|nr:hypothetical protein [Chitinophagaceae bacterium]
MANILVLLSLSFLLGSCEGYNCASGWVQDDADRTALDSVLVEVTSGTASMYTDSSGKFEACNRMASCVPRCKDITVRFSKNGYQPVTLTNPKPESVILLHR